MTIEVYQSTYDIYAHYGRHLIDKHVTLYRTALKKSASRLSQDVLLPRDGHHLPASVISKDAKLNELTIGILGGGIAGLYAALILDSLDIKYEIIEATDRVGGRLYTHKFKKPDGSPSDKYDYFDVGAMRFPNNAVMTRLFHLFRYAPLNTGQFQLNAKLRDYHFKDVKGNSLLYFNDVRRTTNSSPSGDTFLWSELGVHNDYLKVGVDAILKDVTGPFADQLARDLSTGGNEGWKNLMEFDAYSTRAYMSTKYVPSPNLGLPPDHLSTSVVDWCETFDRSTGWYDQSLTETVLEDMCFNLPGEWHLIDGGSEELAKLIRAYLESRKPGSISFNSRVTKVVADDHNYLMHVSIQGQATTKSYPHVISTLPLPCLRAVDLSHCGLTKSQANALRQLTYAASIKIGIKFKSAWWSTAKDRDGKPLDIIGGQSATDRPIRTIVYPSYGLQEKTPSTVLIASYCWTNDAERLGALIKTGRASFDEQLKALTLRDLAAVHNLDISFLEKEFVDIYPWDWSHNPLTMGAFAFFGPGMFSQVYQNLTVPTPNGRFHFAGEALSVRHAWVVGALDSAWRAVKEIILLVHGTESKEYETFTTIWGHNEEWTRRTVPKGAARFPGNVKVKQSEDLLLDHLKLNVPDLFL